MVNLTSKKLLTGKKHTLGGWGGGLREQKAQRVFWC